MRHHDPKALRIAKAVQQREQPELVILFGSRARGDHEELLSDIDVMLVQAAEPDDAIQKAAADAAARVAWETYGRERAGGVGVENHRRVPSQSTVRQQRRNSRRQGRNCHAQGS